MIYPKCKIGVFPIFITVDGYVIPCTFIHPYVKNTDTQFWQFSLHKQRFADLIESEQWNNFLDNVGDLEFHKCKSECGTKDPPTNSFLHEHNNTTVWDSNISRQKRLNVSIETSDRCSLKCLYCARNQAEFVNKTDMPLDIIQDILSYTYLEKLQDCGTYGDPIFYKYYHEMLEFMMGSNLQVYSASIAATGRTQAWWDQTHELWKDLNNGGIEVQINWGIDGLADTSKIHRVGQDWNEITTQMKRAVDNGINCRWRYIPMSFNEHQIDEARQMANDMGVHFFLHHSNRFGENDPNQPRKQ